MSKTVTFTVLVDVQVPDDATHYHGDPTEDQDGVHGLSFYKCGDIGVVGEHWFSWRPALGQWRFLSHTRPSHIEELP